MTNYWSVDVRNLAQFIDRMKRFDEDTYRILKEELDKAGDLVAAAAKDLIPDRGLTNWGPWTVRRARGGGIYTRDLAFTSKAKSRIKARPVIRSSKGQKTTFRVAVQEMDPAGAIWMLAGSVNRSGHQFNANVNKKHGSGARNSGFWPRALTPALYDKGTSAGDAIDRAIQAAVNRVDNG